MNNTESKSTIKAEILATYIYLHITPIEQKYKQTNNLIEIRKSCAK